MVALLVLGQVACDGGGEAPVDASPDADLGPSNAVIHTLRRRTPVAGANVVISRADGNVRAHLLSDATGLIRAHVEPGDLATWVEIDGAARSRDALTVADLQPGDDLVLDPAGAGPDEGSVTGAIDVVVPTWPGANRYLVVSDCGELEGDGALTSCRTDGHVDVLGMAIERTINHGIVVDSVLAYAAHGDVPLGTQLTLGPWAPPGHTTLTVAHPVVPRTSTVASLALVTAGGSVFGIAAGLGILDGRPYPATIDLRYVPGFGASWELVAEATSSDGSGGTLMQRLVARQPVPVPASATLDLSADLLPPLAEVAVDTTTPGRPRFRWSGSQAVDGTGLSLALTLADGARRVTWTAYLPPRTVEFQLPAMPPALHAALPTSERAEQVVLDELDASWQAWPAFRAATDVRHEDDVPVGGRLRRAHLTQLFGAP